MTSAHSIQYRTPTGVQGWFRTDSASLLVAFLDKAESLGWVVF